MSLTVGYCGLTDGSVAGDWRLPNVREMQSLIDYGQDSPALPAGHPFTGVSASQAYWSSTVFARVPSNGVWYVHVQDGNVLPGFRGDPYYVWPVRGGQ